MLDADRTDEIEDEAVIVHVDVGASLLDLVNVCVEERVGERVRVVDVESLTERVPEIDRAAEGVGDLQLVSDTVIDVLVSTD